MAAITQISRIQHRAGLYRELPTALNEAELGWALDTRQLFIGNGPIHPGNTEIITQHTPASGIFYSYKSPIAYQQLSRNGALIGTNPFIASTGFVESYDSNTGLMIGDTDPSTFNATIRSYQEKFDEVVSVKDYRAVGDGIADDTGAILRASKDLYSEEFGAVGTGDEALKRNVALYFPAGVYRIRQHLIGFPNLTFVGDPGKTVIFLDVEISTDDQNSAVLVSADSYGQIDNDMGRDLDVGGNTLTPSITSGGNMQFIGIIFQSNQPFNVSDTGKRQVIRLARTVGAKFEKCGFRFVENVTFNNDPVNSGHVSSLWQPGDNTIDATTAILVTKVNNSSALGGKFEFIDCFTSGCAHDINIIDDTADILVSGHSFEGNLLNVKVGGDASYDYNPSFRHTVSNDGCSNISIEYSSFKNYTTYGIQVFGTSNSVRSFANAFHQTGKSIKFGATTKFCSSMQDWFADTTSASCGTANPRIDNLSQFNTIFNAQDFVTIPNGIQDLSICGNIYITGSILSSPPSVTGLTLAVIAYPSSTNPTTPFKGNSVVVNYAMRIPNSGDDILRTGTFKLIYTEASPGIGGSMQFNDDYVEVGGGNLGSNLTLTAEFDNTNRQIYVKALQASGSPLGTPTTKVIVSALII